MIQVKTRARIPVKIIDDRGMQAIAERAIDLIRVRTRRGLSATGRRFQPYSKSYRSSGQVDTAAPDLHRTGALLESIRVVQVSGRRVVIAALAPYAARVNALRRFMGLAPTDMQALQAVATREAARVLGGG